MPVVLRVRGFKFWFYEADLAEPAHVHMAKKEIKPNIGFALLNSLAQQVPRSRVARD